MFLERRSLHNHDKSIGAVVARPKITSPHPPLRQPFFWNAPRFACHPRHGPSAVAIAAAVAAAASNAMAGTLLVWLCWHWHGIGADGIGCAGTGMALGPMAARHGGVLVRSSAAVELPQGLGQSATSHRNIAPQHRITTSHRHIASQPRIATSHRNIASQHCTATLLCSGAMAGQVAVGQRTRHLVWTCVCLWVYVAFVRAFVHACVRACVRACVHAYMRACVSECV